MLDGRVLGASQVEYKPFGKPPLKRELVPRLSLSGARAPPAAPAPSLRPCTCRSARQRPEAHGAVLLQRRIAAVHQVALRAYHAHRPVAPLASKPAHLHTRLQQLGQLGHAERLVFKGARSGRNAGAGYKRRDWLPVNKLGGATRHPAHLILQLSDET